MTLHIYTAAFQPATRYRVPGIDRWFHSKRRTLIWCRCCKRRRQARNVHLQVYYDMTNAWCKPGKGCKKKKKA